METMQSKLINFYPTFPVDRIKIGRSYQRAIEIPRLNRLINSMKQDGFWPWEAIIVNQDFFVIDGQHRVEAAKKLKLAEVPLSIVSCHNESEEAKWFHRLNSYNTNLKPKDMWHARMLVGNPYAKLLYALCEDSRSLLYHAIAIKGHDTKSSKFTIGDICFMMNGIVFDSTNHLKTHELEYFSDEAKDTSLEDAIPRMNAFVEWFYAIYGNSKIENPIPYRGISIRSIVCFYVKLKRAGFFEQAAKIKQCEAMSRMRSFVFASDWPRIGHAARVNMLINHWNFRRTKYKLSY